MNTTDRWMDESSAELNKRDVSEGRIRDEVDTVRAHLRDAGGDAESAFGDPVVYAAGLAAPAEGGTPDRSTVLVLFVAIASFIVFTLTAVRWVNGDASNAPWAIAGGGSLLFSVAALSISLSRRAVEAALRDTLTRKTAEQWRLSSALVLLLPWAFIGFSGIVIAVAALR